MARTATRDDRVNQCRPFLKWAGGKGALVPQYTPHFPSAIGGYHEPFLGSGAIFFSFRTRIDSARIILSDSNVHLVNCYIQVRDDVNAVIALLSEHQRAHSREHYYKEREKGLEEGSALERAARFIYFNRTCFNGLYRVNRKGRFNVPMGSYQNPTICNPAVLSLASDALEGVTILAADYRDTVARTSVGDFVYLDPPYEPLSPTSNFTSYTAESFTGRNQIELQEFVRVLWQSGVNVAESNSTASLITQLYPDPPYRRVGISASRAINSKSTGRGRIGEYLICNYQVEEEGAAVLLPIPI